MVATSHDDLIAQKDSQILQLTLKLESTQRQMVSLQHQMEQLLRRLYGHRSEKIDPGQMMFDSIILESLGSQKPIMPVAPSEPKKAHTDRNNHPGRIPIPDHLERIEIVLDVPEEKKVNPLTGEPLKLIGFEISEKLEYRPGTLIVNAPVCLGRRCCLKSHA